MINENFQVANADINISVGYHKKTGISRYRTICCALGTLSIDNDVTLKQIEQTIEDIKKETVSNENLDVSLRNGGEKAVFVITLPNEEDLAENLEKFGFKMIYEFHRRDCYPKKDMLKMWIYSWE